MFNEDALLDDDIPDLVEATHTTPRKPLYACPTGVELWEGHRLRNPHAPEVPPEDSDDYPDPDAAGYFVHTQECDLCAEDGL